MTSPTFSRRRPAALLTALATALLLPACHLGASGSPHATSTPSQPPVPSLDDLLNATLEVPEICALSKSTDEAVRGATGTVTLTYFVSDVAYHHDKFVRRGFDRVIDVWGADHHGYVPRMEAAVEAMGRAPGDFKALLIQLVSLKRDGKVVGMSTRAGEFVTLKSVLDEVGVDATRFFFLMRRSDSQLDFDLSLAKKQSSDNPVYYLQYAHARISSILRE